jgi:GNAT superfamily N-acetyltransferase
MDIVASRGGRVSSRRVPPFRADGQAPALVVRCCGQHDVLRDLAAAGTEEAQGWLGLSPKVFATARKSREAGWLERGVDPGRRVRWKRHHLPFAVYAGGRYIGNVGLYQSDPAPTSPENGPPGLQVGLFLVPEWRGQGIGTRLLPDSNPAPARQRTPWETGR